MANRSFDKPTLIVGKRIVEIEGSFVALAGSGTVSASLVKGLGFGYAPNGGTGVMTLKGVPGNNPVPSSTPGIVRTGTGLYTVTLEDPYIDYVTAEAWLMVPAASAAEAMVLTAPTGLNTLQTAPVFSIQTVSSGSTAADLGTTYTICFRFKLRDSTVQYVKP